MFGTWFYQKQAKQTPQNPWTDTFETLVKWIGDWILAIKKFIRCGTVTIMLQNRALICQRMIGWNYILSRCALKYSTKTYNKLKNKNECKQESKNQELAEYWLILLFKAILKQF